MTPAAGDAPGFDAVLLAGGAGWRLGGVDKAAIALRGVRLVDRVSAAARKAGARRVVVVGPEHAAGAHGVPVREDPPGGGPLAAVAAALPSVTAEWVMLLPCDLVHPEPVCAALRRALQRLAPARPGTPARGPSATAGADEVWDGALLRDESGRLQWLAGVYAAGALRRGVAALGGELADAPLRRLFDGARLLEVPARGGISADIDTPGDLARAESETLD